MWSVHSVEGYCVVGAQCGGYAMVGNVLNPAPKRDETAETGWTRTEFLY